MENESESSAKTEEKKGQVRWDMVMDNTLLDVLEDAVREGKKYGSRWDNSVWSSVIKALSTTTSQDIKQGHIENRVRQMKTEFRNFDELKEKSGVTYDPIKQRLNVSEAYWADILSNPIESKKFKVFKRRGPKWDFEKLSTVMGNCHATGSYSLNGLDNVVDVEEERELADANDNTNTEDIEESISSPSVRRARSSK